jgi:hypothetical protein
VAVEILLIFIISLTLAASTVLHYSNGSTVPVDEQTEFIVDKTLYWLSLFVTLSIATGIGFQIVRWMRKKISEDRKQAESNLALKIDAQDKNIKEYINDIVSSARERRDKQDYVIEQLVKRMDGLEEQQKMQMQIVLQNQQNITEFIAAQRQQQQPTLPKKRPSSR